MKLRVWLAWALALVMLLGMLPAAMAEDEHTHNWVKSDRSYAATCQQEGMNVYVCSICGDMKREPISKAAHKWDGGTVTKSPTCVNPGEKTFKCTVCGTSKDESIPATGNHSWGGWSETKAASCTAGGEESRSCSVCGKSETRSTSALGHSWGGWSETKAATCTAGGEESRTCSRCGAKETRSTSALGHSWGKWKTTREATCSRKGEETRKCSVCGRKETRDTKKKAHTFGEWTVVREPTCTEKGERTRTCQKCGQKDTQSIDLLPHTFGEWTVTRAATCTAEGEQTAVCQFCGHEETQSVPMIAHSFGEWDVLTPATCTAEGEQVRTCAACGLEERESVPMLPHAFGEWVVISPLTDWSIGIRERTCAMCGLVEHEENEPAGTVKKGDKGEAVKDLQTALNENGYNCGAADGIFGNKTEAAVKNVEKDNGKAPDGIGWPGVPKLLLGGKNLPELLKLTVTNTNPQPWYAEDFTATFDLALENTSGLDLEGWTLYQKYENDIGIGEWCGVAAGGFLAAGESVLIPNMTYTIGSTDVEGGWAKVSWYVSASAAGGKTIYSNEDSCTLDTQQAAPTVELTADKIGVAKFADGAEVKVPMTLVNTGAGPVELGELKVDAFGPATLSTEDWMSQPLEPLKDYHFTLTILITAEEAGLTETHRTAIVEVKDPDTGAAGQNAAHAFAVSQEEGPSVVLIEEDLTGCGGDVGDVTSLPMYAVNNGDADLAVTELVSGYSTDFANYDHAYDTLFPAGDSFPFLFDVEVLPLDAAFAATVGAGYFYRTIFLRAIPVEGGEMVVATDDPMLWFSGPLPGLKLTMTQTTPDQPAWSPDGSGHIADIEYDCLVENTGERPVLLDSLLAHMYPETEAAFVVLDLGQSVLLEPEGTHSFKAKLPIGAGNITPGSASETIDGLIEVDFAVNGLDPDSLTDIISSNYADNEFSYKVKLNEYEWTPPVEAAPGIAISVEDTTGKGGYENDTIDLQVTVTNSGDTELKDVALDAYSAGGDLGTTDAWTIPAEYVASFLPEDHFTFTYSVDVNADDVSYALANGNMFNRWLIISAVDAATGEPVNSDVKFDLALWIVTDGAISVTKSEESSMPGGYKINQGADCLICVTNNTDDSLYDVEVYDHENGDITGTLIAVIPTLLPHKTENVPYTMWVTEPDATKGKMTNYATAEWVDPATDELKVFTSNEIEIKTQEGEVGGVTVAKSEVGGSLDPAGYALNETVDCDIAVTNETGAALTNVAVLEHPNGQEAGDLIATIPSIADGATEHVAYAMTVTQPDVDRGYMTNKAHVEWTDPASGEAKSEESNIIKMDVKPLETVYGGLTVTKSVEGGPGNGSFYVEGEPITFKVTVVNLSGQKLSSVAIYDPLCGGGMLVEYYDMADGDTRSETFTYTVTGIDVGNTEVSNVANVHAEGEDGTKYIVLSNPAVAPTGVEAGAAGCSVTKTETSAPGNGSFYVQGEKIAYVITVTNTGEVPLDEVIVYDTLKLEDGGELGGEVNLMPSDSRTYTYEYEVDGWDCDNGAVYNDAYAVYRLADGVPHVAFSEVVESPTGFESPSVTPDNGNPPPTSPAGELSPEAPASCVRTLTGLGEGQRAYTLDYCAEHGAIWKTVDALVARADTDEAKLAAWEQAIDLWTEAVRAEYRQALAQAGTQNIPTLMNEQALFFLQLSCHRDTLASLSGGDAVAAAMVAAEQVMNKCADMCFERHTAPEARADSLLAEGVAPLGAAETPERCLRDVTPTDTGAAYVESLCETHAADEALARGALGAAHGEATAEAWRQTKGLWLAELDALTNARYLAADAAGRKIIAAERVSFGNWLKAREAVLELIYPDRPEIVGEVIADAIRARTLSLCGE